MIACPRCATSCPDDSNYCEECGAALVQPAAPKSPGTEKALSAASADLSSCPNCGTKLDQATEFCPQCGIAPSYPDDCEIAELPDLVAMSNHGLRHPKNEDAVMVKRIDTRSFLALSDGVSHSQRPELAAHRATGAALEAFTESPTRPAKDLLRDAVARAHAAVNEIPVDPNLPEDPPCATLTVAPVSPNQIALGWLGDTRAYFFTENSGRLLTQDHSMLNRMVKETHITQAEALLMPGSHALTRAIGGGGNSDEPEIAIYPITEPGLLLLCSDGLWNYAPEPEALYDLVRSHHAIPPKAESLTPLAQALVQYACDRGGADNISVALTSVTPTTGAS